MYVPCACARYALRMRAFFPGKFGYNTHGSESALLLFYSDSVEIVWIVLSAFVVVDGFPKYRARVPVTPVYPQSPCACGSAACAFPVLCRLCLPSSFTEPVCLPSSLPPVPSQFSAACAFPVHSPSPCAFNSPSSRCRALVPPSVMAGAETVIGSCT